MPLISPILDDRDYRQLRAELIQRIPTFAPEWTDHNESDPGIALLDLFAHLGESLLFRFNQIPDTTKIAFLNLLQVPPRPARPAEVLVAARTDRTQGTRLPQGSELRAGAIAFETGREVPVWPVETAAAIKQAAAEATDPAERARRCDALHRLGLGTAADAVFYETVTLTPDPLAAEARPLTVADAVDGGLWLAVLHGEGLDPATVARAMAGGSLAVGVAVDESLPRPFRLDDLGTGAGASGRPGGAARDAEAPPTLWRWWTGTPDEPWQTLSLVGDTTAGLTTTGVVTLALPAGLTPADPAGSPDPGSAAAASDPESTLDAPPVLDDAGQASRLLAWLQATRPASSDSADPIQPVRWVGANAVEASQERAIRSPELLGTGTGEAGQLYSLVERDIVAGSVVLDVDEAGTWREWTEVTDFTASGVDDRHYTVDPTGLVRFGPGGQAGRVPQLGERIRARAYRHGGGATGNVPAGAVTQVTGAPGVTVANPLPATGGRDAEPLDAALDRVPDEVHRRDRAVTPEDYRELALQVPGVARAETLPLLHPDSPAVTAAGVVTVVVLPETDVRDPAAPLPDRTLLRRVSRHLDPRRLVTTELYVVPPEYRRLAVAVGVAVSDGYQVDAVRRWVELVLRQFLAPVPPYGPDGQGWPLGRTVREAELEAIAVQVEGVSLLEGLALAVPATAAAAAQGDEGWSTVPTVALERWQLPQLTDLTVVTGPPLAPGAGYQPVSPGGPGGPGRVYAPLPRDVC